MKTLMNKYRENEEQNLHTENYLLLAKNFGTPDQVDAVQKILEGNNKRGYANITELQQIHKKMNPYFVKLAKITTKKEIIGMVQGRYQRLKADRILWNQKFN